MYLSKLCMAVVLQQVPSRVGPSFLRVRSVGEGMGIAFGMETGQETWNARKKLPCVALVADAPAFAFVYEIRFADIVFVCLGLYFASISIETIRN